MLTINATERHKYGKSNSRQLRKDNKIPAIIYNKKQNSICITLIHDEIMNKKNNDEFLKIINLTINNKEIKVKIKEIQFHPFKPQLMHIDFIMINQ